MHPRNPLHFGEILVCLDGSSYSQAAVEYATQIALEHKASLTGIGVIDLPGIQRSSGPAPIGAMHYDRLADQQHFQETREVVSGVLEDFGKTCQEKGIRHSIHSEMGSPFREIIEESKFPLRGRADEAILSYIREHAMDLLVMGAYGKRSVSEFVFGSVTKSLVEQAGIPLFIYH